MNLNQIRILEACHKFLNGITLLKEELQNDNLVYQYNRCFPEYASSQSFTKSI